MLSLCCLLPFWVGPALRRLPLSRKNLGQLRNCSGVICSMVCWGTLTKLARKDVEGADVGWMAMGLFITVPCGFLAVLLFRLGR